MPAATTNRAPAPPTPAPPAPTSTLTWTDEQRSIFSWLSSCARNIVRHLVVIARAGTGKTTVIVNGLQHLAPGLKVLVTSFAKSITDEMKSKAARVPKRCDVDVIGLHALGYRYIRERWQGRLRFKETITSWRAQRLALDVMPEDAPKKAVTLVKNIHTKGRELNPFATADELAEIAIRFGDTPDPDVDRAGYDLTTLCQYARSAMLLAANGPTCDAGERYGYIDFADMLFLPVYHGWITPTWDVVIVDEYQDMSPTQLTMAQAACKYSLVVVGDPRQGIYGFRGADTQFAHRIERELAADTLTLSTTFRCSKSIVDVARDIVPDYRAHDTNPAGEVIPLDCATGYDRLYTTCEVGSAVLSRVNAPLVSLTLGFLRNGVPARMKGRTDFAKGIEALVNQLSTGSASNSIPQLLTKLASWETREIERVLASKLRDPDSAIDTVRDRAETVRALAEGADSIRHLKSRLEQIYRDIDSDRCVTMSTVHKAKGLEWKSVYVLADTLKANTLEEMNISYVAVTRAIAKLTLVNGDAGMFYGLADVDAVENTTDGVEDDSSDSADSADTTAELTARNIDEQRDSDLVTALFEGRL